MSNPAPLEYLSCPAGLKLARQILRPVLPYDCHDYQLEGICKAVDGMDILGLIPTGGGKTGLFFMYILLLLEIQKWPWLVTSLKKKHPVNPAMVIVSPTNGLEAEMAAEFEKMGLRSVAINSQTLHDAACRDINLWKKAETDASMILVSPEKLTSDEYKNLLKVRAFTNRVVALGVDEIHLLASWGSNFRKAFQQIGNVRHRMPRDITLIATTATLLSGATTTHVCRFLGLSEVFRPLSRGLGGYSFPDLNWVLTAEGKTIIFAKTVALSFRIFAYLRNADMGHGKTRIRMYNSVNSEDFNENTRRLFHDDPDCKILIATDTLSVGFNFRTIRWVVIVKEPSSADDVTQKEGRAGRDEEQIPEATCVLYYTAGAMKTAASIMDSEETARANRKGGDESMDRSMAMLLLATCKRTAQNELYSNPISDALCACEGCTASPPRLPPTPCNCCGCQPETNPPPMVKPANPPNPVPKSKRLTKPMRAAGLQILLVMRDELYELAPRRIRVKTPDFLFLPDNVIKTILDRFALLDDIPNLIDYIGGNSLLEPHQDKLLATLAELQVTFASMKAEHSAELKRRKMEKAAQANLPQAPEYEDSVDGIHAGEEGFEDVSEDEGGHDGLDEQDKQNSSAEPAEGVGEYSKYGQHLNYY